jgi:hypothetical protein
MEPPDPRRSYYVFAHGKKGSGKSHYSRAWFDSYPFDRMVIDVTGDISRDLRAENVEFQKLDASVLPARLPPGPDEQHPYVTAVLVPDMGSPTAMDDMDRAIGLTLRGDSRQCLLWIDEIGSVCNGNKTPPNMRRVLHHGRHHNLTCLMAGPRTMDVDPLCIAQADLVASFRTPQVYDRQRVADTIGYPRDEYDQLNQGLSGHEYTAYDAVGDQMYVMPPLPPRRAGRNNYAPVPS